MRSTLLLAVILALSLALGTVCEESQEQTVPHGGHREKFPDINQLLKTLSGSGSVSVDELLKILGKASKDPKKLSLLQKRDMHDFFVGLMGKRNIQPASPSFWGQGEGHIQKNSNYMVYFTPDTPIGVNQENVPGFGSLEYPHNME